MMFLLVLLAIWLIGNVGYVIRNRLRMGTWEKKVQRGTDGKPLGAAPFEQPVENATTAILLVHGYANSPDVWRDMMPPLVAAGFSVEGIQLPGFMVPAMEGQTKPEEWIDALGEAVDALRTDHEQVWVMAHSLGCAVTLAGLHREQLELDGLVFYAPLIDVSSARSPLFSVRTWHHIGKGLLFAPRIMENVFPPDVNDKAAGEALIQDRFIHRSVHDSLFALTGSLPETAEFVSIPMLVFIAPDDQVVDVPRIEGYLKTASGPAKRVEAAEAGHVIPIDLGWEKHLQTAVEFIRQHGEPSP